jgi:anti-sigma factor RsiW
MKPCPDHKQSVALLAAGALDPDGARRMKGHLETCASCRAYAAAMEQVCARVEQSAPLDSQMEPSPGFHSRLKHRIQQVEHRPGTSILATLLSWAGRRQMAFGGVIVTVIVTVFWLAFGFSEHNFSDRPSRAHPASQASRSEPPIDLARTSTLIAYQNAFNQSLEELDTLLARNTAQSPSGDGMMLRSTEERSWNDQER